MKKKSFSGLAAVCFAVVLLVASLPVFRVSASAPSTSATPLNVTDSKAEAWHPASLQKASPSSVTLNPSAQSLPVPEYDEQMSTTFTQAFTVLAYNVTAIAQTDSYGYGPAYLLNGLTNNGYWYQVGLDFDWPSSIGGHAAGFNFSYEVWNNAQSSIFPASGGAGLVSFSGPVANGNIVLLKLNFTAGNVTMYAHDWNTGSTAQKSYAAFGTSFVGLSSGPCNNNGFFTGLMTEWYRVNPFYGDIQGVTYSEHGVGLASAWMLIRELNALTGQTLFEEYTNTPVVYSPPAQLLSFFFNGATEYSNAYEFITGLGNCWPTFLHDPCHSGYSIYSGPSTNQTIWNYTTGWQVSSSPAVANGVVYVGSELGYVYALNAATGKQIWNYTIPTGGEVSSSPAVANGVVYVGSWDYNVYALNATTGKLVWKYQTGAQVYSSPAVANGVVYVGSGDDYVYALNATTGKLVWKYQTGGVVDSSPAVANGTVYVGSEDHYVYALSATKGTPVWKYQTGGGVSSSPAVANGVVYVGSEDNLTWALNAATGTPVWTYLTDEVSSSPAVANGVVYVGSELGYVYALNATTSLPVWKYLTNGMVDSSPAVANGTVYVGSEDHYVYALSATKGTPVWKYQTGGGVSSSPAVANGVVYVGSEDFKVYAFGKCAVSISPSSATMDVGQSKVFSSSVSGSTSSYTYQWYLNGFAVSGATGSSWTFTPSSTGFNNVYLTITGAAGVVATSNTATVTVNPALSISILPISVTMDVGQSKTFTASVTGGTSPYSYWWGYSNSSGSGAIVYAIAHGPTQANTTATSTTWAFTPSSPGTYIVLCIVADSVGGTAVTGYGTAGPWANVTVNAALSVTISPTSAVIYYLDYDGEMIYGSQTFTTTVSGGTSPFSYQWYLNGVAVSGATSASWTFTPSKISSYTVYATVTDSVGMGAKSNTASVTMEIMPGGCVLAGTCILMADGKEVPVQDVKPGDEIMGYDVQTGTFVAENVTSNKCTIVNEILSINDGLLCVTPTDQPIYTDHGWVVNPQDLKIGWRIYDPTSNSWITIQSLQTLKGHFDVYDLRATEPNTFIGNGILLDKKVLSS